MTKSRKVTNALKQEVGKIYEHGDGTFGGIVYMGHGRTKHVGNFDSEVQAIQQVRTTWNRHFLPA